LFANIRKFTIYVLASNVPEMLPYLLFIVLPVPLALDRHPDPGRRCRHRPAAGYCPWPGAPDPELMQQPPRGQHASLLTPVCSASPTCSSA